jgi:hypothetical protein
MLLIGKVGIVKDEETMKKSLLRLSALAISTFLSGQSQAEISYDDDINGAVKVNYVAAPADYEEMNALNRRYDKQIWKLKNNDDIRKSVTTSCKINQNADLDMIDVEAVKSTSYRVRSLPEKILAASVEYSLKAAAYCVGQFYGTALTSEFAEKTSRKAMDFLFGEVPYWSFANLNRWTAAKDIGVKAAPHGANILTRGLNYFVDKITSR